jgi:hypothetical protein
MSGANPHPLTGGAFAARDVILDWWLWLILGLLEVALG